MNPALIGKLVGVLAIIAAAGWLYMHGKHVESLEGRDVTKTIILDKAVKNAEISTNRPDFDTLVDGVWASGNY